jgi:hypothetical protein
MAPIKVIQYTLLDHSRDNVLIASSAAPDTHNHTNLQPHNLTTYCREVINLKNSRNTATAPCYKSYQFGKTLLRCSFTKVTAAFIV